MNSLRLSVVWPAFLALVLLLVYGWLEVQISSFLPFILLAGIAACIFWLAFAAEFRVRRPLHALLQIKESENTTTTSTRPLQAADEVQGLATKMFALQRDVARGEEELKEESLKRPYVKRRLAIR